MLAAAASLVVLRDTGGDCGTAVPLTVAAAPAIAPAIQSITKRDIDASCIAVRVVEHSPAETSAGLSGASPDTPALWIPDSSLWPKLARQGAASQGGTPPLIEERGSLVMSPLVAVTSRTMAGQFGLPDAQPSWQELIGGPVATVIGDPLTTTEGLSTLVVVRQLLGTPDGPPRPELVGALLKVGRNAVSSMQSAYDRLGASAELAFTASEQSVLAYNQAAERTPVVAMYPREGTVPLDYPLVRVSRPGEAVEIGRAADQIEVALRSPQALATFQAAGFRSSDGTWETPPEDTGINPARPKLTSLPAVEQANDVLRTWSAVNLDVRMLVLIDVSGSMDADAGNGQTRIELTRDTALTALQLYPDSTDVGLWAFSIQQAPPNDWIELVPMGAVGQDDRRTTLQAAFASLPGRTDGGTGLNDSVLAAFRTLRNTYDPGRVNTVVLLTDGRNEDPDGIDENALLEALRVESDPARPVPVMPIGVGPEVDFPALQRIAAATGGKAYQAMTAADIRAVFLDAIIQRRCRPAC